MVDGRNSGEFSDDECNRDVSPETITTVCASSVFFYFTANNVRYPRNEKDVPVGIWRDRLCDIEPWQFCASP